NPVRQFALRIIQNALLEMREISLFCRKSSKILVQKNRLISNCNYNTHESHFIRKLKLRLLRQCAHCAIDSLITECRSNCCLSVNTHESPTLSRQIMDENQAKEYLRQIPGVDAVLQMEAVRDALSRHPRKLVLDAIREELDENRNRILQSHGSPTAIDPSELARSIAERA